MSKKLSTETMMAIVKALVDSGSAGTVKKIIEKVPQATKPLKKLGFRT